MDIFRRLGIGEGGAKGGAPRAARLSLSNYRLLRTLGTGSFGRVFIAKRVDDPAAAPVAIKRLKKASIVKHKQVDHLLSEKKILATVKHPFLVELHGTFQDERYLYIVLEFVIGGEFFTHLRKTKRFSNDAAVVYAGQVALMFEYLHGLNIIYRDLKPENLLIDASGHLKLTDFGFAKVVDGRTYTLCGTPEYIAPEVLLNKGHGKAVDWWTFGVLIYEMLVGYPPFFDNDPLAVYQKILAGRIAFPRLLDAHAKSLVKALLTPDLSKRYGNLRGGVFDIKEHKWFAGLDWNALLKKQVKPPFKPPVKAPDDTSNFEPYPESTDQPPVLNLAQDPFRDW